MNYTIEPISRETVLCTSGGCNSLLNKVLHELNKFDSSLYKSYTLAVIGCGFDSAVVDTLPKLYNAIPYTKRSYHIL